MTINPYDYKLMVDNNYWIPEMFQSTSDITGVYSMNLFLEYIHQGKEPPWDQISFFQIYSVVYSHINDELEVPEKWIDEMINKAPDAKKLKEIAEKLINLMKFSGGYRYQARQLDNLAGYKPYDKKYITMIGKKANERLKGGKF